ncbi:MAG: AzlC family ABC transporter permease [Candidatus Dormibacteraeota bacterium]|nr:AzlC family ABC transporter permease [Candidatus Dormibacteraeota bacterium]
MRSRTLESSGLADYLAGARMMAPMGLGDLLDGVAFGVVAAASMGSIAPVVMSVLAFSGTAQFATSSVLSQHGTLVAAAVATLAVNSRYLVMGVTLAPVMEGGRVRRFIQSQFVTDASWALSRNGEGSRAKLMVGAGAVSRLAWTAGTAAGLLGADHLLARLGGAERLGLDAVYPAFFLYLLVQAVGRDRAQVLASLTAAAAALALVPVAPAGLPILGAAALGPIAGWLAGRRR